MNDENRPGDSTNTRIDLGEDLLEQTGTQTAGESSISSAPADDLDGQYESAKILRNEGMLEQAKRILHRILIQDSSHVPARRALEEIHEMELAQIFSEQRARRILGRRSDDIATVDAEQVLGKLDRDLGLKLNEDQRPSLLRDADSLKTFIHELEKQLSAASPQDRIDLGVGFLEIGLFEVAAHQFRAAYRSLSQNKEAAETAIQTILGAANLLATALILGAKPLEATACLHPIIRDSELRGEDKLESLYLMGRACEVLEDPGTARGWYQQAYDIDPYYRDVRERLGTK